MFFLPCSLRNLESLIQTIPNRLETSQICQPRQEVVFMHQNDLETSEEDKKDCLSRVHQIFLILNLALPTRVVHIAGRERLRYGEKDREERERYVTRAGCDTGQVGYFPSTALLQVRISNLTFTPTFIERLWKSEGRGSHLLRIASVSRSRIIQLGN